jgi:acyl-CoA synthetase (AMP-forming)/AMP-acid ligase II
MAGCTIILSESWLPADISRAVAAFGVTGISAVPAIWNDLLNAGINLNSAEHSSLRYVTVSGGDLPLERLLQLKNAIGDAGIFKTYGQSETFRSAALRPSEFADKPRSVGRIFASASVRIERADRTDANPNEAGEIVHSGLGTMLGYLDAESNQALHQIRTGDVGWLDEDGFLFVQGRRDTMLKIAGNRVYPSEIANQIATLPGIHEVEIIGEKDATGETQLVAFIVAANGAMDADEIRRALMQRLPSYMIPRQIVMLPQMPRTTSGKPDRVALKSQLTMI